MSRQNSAKASPIDNGNTVTNYFEKTKKTSIRQLKEDFIYGQSQPDNNTHFDYDEVGKKLRRSNEEQKKESKAPSYYRFPMVFLCKLTNKKLFEANHTIITEKGLVPKKVIFMSQSKRLFLERDQTSFEKCKHAVKVIFEVKRNPESTQYSVVQQTQGEQGCSQEAKFSPVLDQYTLGFIPTDVSYGLAQLIDENRNYFNIDVTFPETSDTGTVQVQVDLAPNLIRDHKIKDSDLNKNEFSQDTQERLKESPCYSVKRLWGMPKQFQKVFLYLNKFNQNKTIGFDVQHEGSPMKFENSSEYLNYENQGGSNSQLIGDLTQVDQSNQSTAMSGLNSQSVNQYKDLVNKASQRQPACLEEDNTYSRNFELVLRTAIKYEHLFTEQESRTIKMFMNQETSVKTLYARMYFRKRFWYTPKQLKNYAEHPKKIEKALRILHSLLLLKSDEDCLYETDYERLYELFECMVLYQVKQVEDNFKKAYRGTFQSTSDQPFDCISMNPWHSLKVSTQHVDSPFKPLLRKLSRSTSEWVRLASEQHMATGKKVNVFLNFAVTDKVKLVNRLMNRIVAALGPSPMSTGGSSKTSPSTDEPSGALSLLNFLSVCKNVNNSQQNRLQGEQKQSQNGVQSKQTLRERLLKCLYSANEESRAYYLDERPRQLFARCLRLFFFYQSKDAYESLMLHDYGFYQFEKFDNFMNNPDTKKPLFTNRDQFLRYDECSSLIGASFQYLNIRLKSKEKEAKVATWISKRIFLYFNWQFKKEQAEFFMQEKLQELLNTQNFTDGLIKKNQLDPLCTQVSEILGVEPEQADVLQPTQFIKRFSEEYAHLNLLDKTFFMLERGKDYPRAILCLLLLLSKIQIWVDKRGYWFQRLVMNLKHLRMKKEAVLICDLALHKQGPMASQWIKIAERNTILKIRVQLYADLMRQQAKLNKNKISVKHRELKKKDFRQRKLELLEEKDPLKLAKQKETKMRHGRMNILDSFLDRDDNDKRCSLLPDFSQQTIRSEAPQQKKPKEKRKRKLNEMFSQSDENELLISENSSSAASSQDSILNRFGQDKVYLTQEQEELKPKILNTPNGLIIELNKETINEILDSTPEKLPSPLSFLELHGVEDVDKAIEIERKKTFHQLTRMSDQLEYDARFYNEVFLRAQRAYAGQHMKAVYTDQKSNQFFNVENLALKYYGQKEGWNGLHVENQLMKQCYGILMWDEIFYDKIDYVFQTPFQFGPLDFNEPEFYTTRKHLIEAKLELISNLAPLRLKSYFEQEYEKHKNVHNPLVNWDNLKLTKARMATILSCMGSKVLVMFLSKLASDYKAWSYGMPDLILWKYEKNKDLVGTIKFVEVKSEYDTLSEQQKCWIAMITKEEVNVDLCKITDKVEGVDIF